MPIMFWVYCLAAAVHLLAVIVSGILWTIVDLNKESPLKHHLRDIQAVHFGCLYLFPMFLILGMIFRSMGVPWEHQVAFPAGLFLLVAFSSLGYVFPRPPGLNPFYYWTKGPAMICALIGIVCMIVGLVWTAAVLVIWSWPFSSP
jgi:hypothetical protein